MKNEKQHPIAHLMLKACQKVENSADYKVSDIEFSLVPVGGSAYVCAIRSTEFFPLSKGNWRDTVRNLTVIPWYDKRVGWCHLGYLLAARKVVKAAKEQEPHKRIYGFTGFSMGGAIALVASALSSDSRYNIYRPRAFGSPSPLYRKIRSKYYNWVFYTFNNDIVTKWPPFSSDKFQHHNVQDAQPASLKTRLKAHRLANYVNNIFK